MQQSPNLKKYKKTLIKSTFQNIYKTKPNSTRKASVAGGGAPMIDKVESANSLTHDTGFSSQLTKK